MLKNVRPKKFLGQHFLKDQNTAKAIADTIDACAVGKQYHRG